MVKYRKRDDAQIRAWLTEYEIAWGVKIAELCQEYRQATHQHQYSSSSHQPPSLPRQESHPQSLHRRLSDARRLDVSSSSHSGSRGLHALVQRETSTCKYRSASNSPISHPLGESRPHHSANHSLPDRDGRLGSTTKLVEAMGSMIGYDGNDKYLTYIEWDKEVRIGWLSLEGIIVLIFLSYDRVVQGAQVISVMESQMQAPVIFQAEDKATFYLCCL